MSAAAIEDATGTGSPAHASADPGSHASPESGSQAHSNDPSGTGDTVSPDPRLQRFKEDPEWAWDQFKAMESKFGRANTERDQLKPLGELQSFVDTYGGIDTLRQNLDFYTGLMRDPNAVAALRAYQQTGQLNASPAADETEYLDDEQKELRSLKAELAKLRSSVTDVGAHQTRAKFKEMFANVFKDFPGMTEAHRAKVMAHSMETINRNALTQEGLQALDNLTHENARALMMVALSPQELKEAIDNESKNRSEANQSRATQATGVTTAGEGRQGRPAAMEAFEEFCRDEGLNAANPFGFGRG